MTAGTRFEALIERHHDELYSYLWRLLGDAADAEDVTQEVFLRAYQAFPRLRANSNHRAWLYKIATNCAYTLLKRRHRAASRQVALLDDVHAAAEASPEAQADRRETMEAIGAAIESLPPKQRAAIILRHWQGLDYAAIAAALDCSEDSARANVYQSVRRLRQVLGG